MKNKMLGSLVTMLLVVGLFQFMLSITPVVVGDQSYIRREIWQVINITNPLPYSTLVDVNITVNSRDGVYVACSTNITKYFNQSEYWQDLGYATYMDWLNGTSTLPYHWGEMDWVVSNGSLGSISYDAIQHWGEMYFDSGGGVNYTTFMGNTYMADWNLTDPNNDPDIVFQTYWKGNEIKMVDDLMISNGTSMYVVFKIVITKSGAYTFNVTTTPGVTVSPLTWTVGGVATLLVPYDYPTIQSAINAAMANYTIIVYSGTYVEDLVIPSTKTNLEIKPAEGASVTIKGIQNALAGPNIGINASGVKIHGFIIEGPNYAAGNYSSGMVIGASNVAIYNNTFKVTPAANTDEVSRAIQTYHKNAIPGVDVSGLIVYNNTFTHLSDGAAGFEGIYINLDEGNGTVKVQYNQFIGNVLRAITTERSNTIISNNTIITDLAPGLPGGYQGINVGGANSGNVTNVSVANNTIKGSASGKGFMYGIKLGYAATSVFANVSIVGNAIQLNEVGVWVNFSAGGVEVRWNNIFNNTNYGVLNNATETLNAAYNWWGNETGPWHSTNPTGLGDNVSDNVLFEPWLIKPYPPAVAVCVVYVNPNIITMEAPALGTLFTVNVTIANVSMMYGFQFVFKWNSTLITLTNPTTAVRIPTVWGSNYISSYNYSLTGGNYSLYAAARSPAPTFNGTTAVASLTFRSIYDPSYPVNVTCALALENVIVADMNATPIQRLVYNGNYSCYSVKPKFLFMAKEYTAKKVPTEFDASINVTNIVNLSAFRLVCTFNTTMLNVLNVNVPALGGSPTIVTGLDNTVGYFWVNVTGISPAINGSKILVNVRFKVQQGFIWNTLTPTVNCSLVFIESYAASQDGTPIEHELINGTYIYKPVPGDLNMDGLVDIVDLVTVAGYFGTTPGGPPYHAADINCDGYIDILDIILVARNFGRTEP